MDILYSYQVNLLNQVNDTFYRSLFNSLPWDQRMIAIKGIRGVGKTTMLLQFLKYQLHSRKEALYATLDHPWFYTNTLFDLADNFYTMGGRHLLLDEIHKYPNWSRELKLIYDGYPDLNVVFTASSALEIYRGESDLSRRVNTYELPGMSFREYLKLENFLDFPEIDIQTILKNHHELAQKISSTIKPVPLFKDYLQQGYLPFSTVESTETYLPKVQAIINNVLEFDLSFIEGYSTSSQVKIKKLLGTIAESSPFEPNISSLARKMNMGRDTVNNFIQHLNKGRIINLIQRKSKGVAALQKPDKIYLENTNFSYALKERPDHGTLRETFLLGQLRNINHSVTLPEKGDFFIEEEDLLLEVGGKSKTIDQIRNQSNAYIVADDIEVGINKRIPLWLFGFLY